MASQVLKWGCEMSIVMMKLWLRSSHAIKVVSLCRFDTDFPSRCKATVNECMYVCMSVCKNERLYPYFLLQLNPMLHVSRCHRKLEQTGHTNMSCAWESRDINQTLLLCFCLYHYYSIQDVDTRSKKTKLFVMNLFFCLVFTKVK